MSRRILVWRGLDAWRAEVAHAQVAAGQLEASGTQIGADPEPYRLDYELVRAEDGSWTANGEAVPAVQGALDCDLGLCPLTNTMPVLRERLLEESAQPTDFVMAWVSVPDLAVHRSQQRYEPIDIRHVRYVGEHRDFVAELELDEDGFVVRYPELADRL